MIINISGSTFSLLERLAYSLLSRIVQSNLLQDLVEESALGVVTEIELLAESLHDHPWVIILVHFNLLNVLPIEFDLKDADWLVFSEVGIKIVVWRADCLFVGAPSSSARSFRDALKGSFLRTERCVVPIMLHHIALRLLLPWLGGYGLSPLHLSIVCRWDFVHWLLDICLVLSGWSISLVEDVLGLFLLSLGA